MHHTEASAQTHTCMHTHTRTHSDKQVGEVYLCSGEKASTGEKKRRIIDLTTHLAVLCSPNPAPPVCITAIRKFLVLRAQPKIKR
eukprot:3025397-Rhodomonas_salina.1